MVQNNSGRKPWVAGVLTGLAPGLGQVYCGQWQKGLIYHLLLLGIAVAGGLSILWIPFPPFNVIVPSAMLMMWLLYILVDAIRTGKKLRDDYQLKPYNKWYIYVGVIVLVSFGEPALPRLLMKAYAVPSGGMIPTLLRGDQVLIDKILYRFADPRRKDVITFLYPEDESKTFVKRIIGLPGDNVTIRNKVVSVNGVEIKDEDYTQYDDPAVIDGHISHRDNFGPISVPTKAYFVLGDNRDYSLDSRFWGFVEREKILGKVATIYWSWDSREREIRWSRLGQFIH
jgi:signal peptidase I